MDTHGNKKIIYFDLGDTLLYRVKTQKEFDIDALISVTGLSKDIVVKTIGSDYDNMYTPRLDKSTLNLKQEMDNQRKLLLATLVTLGKGNQINELLLFRSRQKRYKLFPGVIRYLTKLKPLYDLGIITNGRPSRRIVMKNLGILNFFIPDLIYISDEMGASKPDLEISKIVKGREFYDQVILVDDEENNLFMAKSFGWDFVHIKHSKNQTLEVLNQYL